MEAFTGRKRTLVQAAFEVCRLAYGRCLFRELHLEMKRIREDREYSRNSRQTFWEHSGFDVFDIRWMFEGGTEQIHPEDDWDHPAWSNPEGVLSAYDPDY